MDIEKICRTCLALNGPLLSIFDGSGGGGGGSGCVADMLSNFTKMKPKQTDKMPEKVCLACISEINRCYSFKMKCENANKTLLQLLPDALDAHEIELKQEKAGEKQRPELLHKEVQTMPAPTESKQMRSTPMQTMPVQKVQQAHQEVQTETQATSDANTSPFLSSKARKPQEKTTVIKVERAMHLDSSDLTHLSNESGNKNSSSISPRIEEKKNIKKLKLKQLQLDDAQAQNHNEIIYEIESESGNANNSSDDDDEMNSGQRLELGSGAEGNETTYFVYSDSQQEEEEEYLGNEYESEGGNNDATTSQSSRSRHMEQQTLSHDDEKNDYNFTIIQMEEGREEISETIQTSEIATRLQSKMRFTTRKPELKCKVCHMPFASVQNLLKHYMKMHQWTEAQTQNMQYQLQQLEAQQHEEQPDEAKEQQQQQDATGEEQTLDIVLEDNMHASLLEELHAEVVVEKVEQQQQQIKFEQKTLPPVKTEYALTVFCPRCNAGFAFTKALNYHLKQNQCTAVTFSCDECQRVFTTEHGLEEHRESHLLQHACNECNLMFNDMPELCEHMIKVHDRSFKNQCHICSKVFTMTSALKDHLRIHSGEKPFKCTMCDKAFRQNSNLKQHIMRHSQIKPFNCDTCTLSFVSKAELFSHKRKHTGDHPFRCEFCDACYTTSSSLVKHRRKHTGERPYACEFCPMRFSALNVLKNHRRTHTGEKPFACTFCNKRFTQKSDCQIHQRTHTGEKRYTCMCGSSFTHLSTMRMHQKVHENEGAAGGSSGGSAKKRRRVGAAKAGVKTQQKRSGVEQDENDENSRTMQHEDEALVVNDATNDDEFMTLAMSGMV